MEKSEYKTQSTYVFFGERKKLKRTSDVEWDRSCMGRRGVKILCWEKRG